MTARGTRARRLLFITRSLPGPGAGNGVYARDLLGYLQDHGFDIQILWLDANLLASRRPRVPPALGFRLYCPGFVRLGNRFWNWRGIWHVLRHGIAAAFKPLPPRPASATYYGPLTTLEREWIARAARAGSFGIVVANYCWLAEALDAFGTKVRTFVLTHDVWHQHVLRDFGDANLKALDQVAEARLLERVGTIVAISDGDAAVFKGMLPQKPIVVAPMSCSARVQRRQPVPGRLLFVGSSYAPNVEGVLWFMREVGPLLEASEPGHFLLHVVGDVCSELSRQPPIHSIQWVACGYLPDLADEYGDSEIVIAPIQRGTGVKIKVVEAIAHGRIVVASPGAAIGLEQLTGDALHVAGSAQQFAELLLGLSRDRAHRLSCESAAREAATRQLSPTACYGALLEAMTQADAVRIEGMTP